MEEKYTMKRAELLDEIRKVAEKTPINPRRLQHLVELYDKMDKRLAFFKKHVRFAKEMTEEYQDFPSTSNLVCMELAQSNVLNILDEMVQDIFGFYEQRLTTLEKRMLPPKHMTKMFVEAITNQGEDNQ